MYVKKIRIIREIRSRIVDDIEIQIQRSFVSHRAGSYPLAPCRQRRQTVDAVRNARRGFGYSGARSFHPFRPSIVARPSIK